MKRQQTSTDAVAVATDSQAVQRCLEAYGADIDKWPADKRARYGALAASAEMTAMREDAASLDGFLNAATAPRMSDTLKNRIAAQYVAPPPAAFTDLSVLLSLLRPAPAGALAGLGALGFAVGLMTDGGEAALTPEYEAYAYLEDTLAPALIDEEGAVLWDAD